MGLASERGVLMFIQVIQGHVSDTAALRRGSTAGRRKSLRALPAGSAPPGV